MQLTISGSNPEEFFKNLRDTVQRFGFVHQNDLQAVVNQAVGIATGKIKTDAPDAPKVDTKPSKSGKNKPAEAAPKAETPEAPKVETPPAEPANTEAPKTVDDARNALKALAAKHGMDASRKLLDEYKVAKVSDVPEGDRGAFVAKASLWTEKGVPA